DSNQNGMIDSGAELFGNYTSRQTILSEPLGVRCIFGSRLVATPVATLTSGPHSVWANDSFSIGGRKKMRQSILAITVLLLGLTHISGQSRSPKDALEGLRDIGL